jgi:hypothetical protein
MANRFAQQKPNPAIKKQVLRARQSAKGSKRGQGLVVAISMAATITGWGFFSHQEAQSLVTAQLAEPTAIVASAQQVADTSPTPLVTGVFPSNAAK